MPWDPSADRRLLGGGADPRERVIRPWPRFRAALGAVTPVVVDVGDYAEGDGTDETEEIQAAIADVPLEGGVLYFPPGTYGVGAVSPLLLQSRRCLTLIGVGRRSVLRRLVGAAQDDDENGLRFDDGPGILRLEDCQDVCIRDLAFDGNGWVPAGDNLRALVTVYASESIRIERNRVFDSAPNESLAAFLETGIREEYSAPHAVAFGFFHHVPDAEIPVEDLSTDIVIADNDLDSFGIAAHHVSDVRITGNRIQDARAHGVALGAEGESSGAIHDNIEIRDNIIENPSGYGIVAADIAPVGGRIVGVQVIGNRIRKSNAGNALVRGIVVGALRPRAALDTPVAYDSIVVSENDVDLTSDLAGFAEAAADQMVGIWMTVNRPDTDNFGDLALVGGDVPADTLRACIVRGNIVTGATAHAGGTGIVVHNFFRGTITGNGVYGSTSGIDLRGFTRLCHVHDNRVEPSPDQAPPYLMTASLGGNWFSGNAVLGGVPGRAFWPEPAFGRDGVTNGDLRLGELGG